jgi:hypothetical protein
MKYIIVFLVMIGLLTVYGLLNFGLPYILNMEIEDPEEIMIEIIFGQTLSAIIAIVLFSIYICQFYDLI